ncbi:MOSC domain-containing protein [Bacillus sp. V3-13]|uniref:MOSC domain-containing protein n=1 Tax=Bacillus sp. V3-13 TaxID=2053728 RepID=UPI000C787D14|nr:MOSC domain-containing protein [Bacillus sp. V3-13]PLR78423.1 MOSC domain-containing protein [Bacillus sp. V3-13]
MNNNAPIIALSVGEPKDFLWKGQEEKSAIGKTPIQEVLLTKEGFIGDGVANHEFHGGPERAVCLYPFEHYSLWEKEFKVPLQPPAFGENITIAGMREADVYIGNIYRMGNAVVQISQGRVPCSTISKHNGMDHLLKRIVETGFTGYFFRVLEEGMVFQNSHVELVEENAKKVSILFANQTLFHDRKNKEAIEKILEVEELAPVWQEKLKRELLKERV